MTLFLRRSLALLPVILLSSHWSVAHAATISVTSGEDNGIGSLRQAIAAAAAGDTIVLDSAVLLTTDELLINKSLTIQGTGTANRVIARSAAEGTPNFRVFEVGAGATVRLTNLAISGGHSVTPNGYSAPATHGGGIYNGGTLILTRCTVSQNRTGDGAAAIYSPQADGYPEARAGGNGGSGGGIYNTGSLTLASSTISGNSTGAGGSGGANGMRGFPAGYSGDGGGIYNAAAARITNSTISGNSTADGVMSATGGFGGGIYNAKNIAFSSCTVSGNITGRGGDGGRRSFQIFQPANGGDGGGLHAGTGSATKISNTVFADNATGAGGSYSGPPISPVPLTPGIPGNGLDIHGAVDSLDYNLIEKTSGATVTGSMAHNVTGVDPKLGPLQDNGGEVQTVALLAGSTAIDAGDSTLAVDQRGVTRPQGAKDDIGAFEVTGGSTVPQIRVTTPANYAKVTTLASIAGTATDEIGVSKVLFYLRRRSDGKYWTGTAWGAATPLNATVSGTTWARSSGLPTGSDLTVDSYVITAYAFDAANNRSAVISNFSVSESIAPTVAITSPANGTTVAALTQVTGTAGDSGGSGLQRVAFYFRRLSDLNYWNGRYWAPTIAELPTTITGNTWKTTAFALPAGFYLEEGRYRAQAISVDGDHNKSTQAVSTFTYKKPGVVAEASGVMLSSIRATADGSIQLVFTGPLSASAADATSYTVQQDGAAVTASGAELASANTATLSTDGLAAGSRVTVNYSIEDAAGRAVTGTANAVVK